MLGLLLLAAAAPAQAQEDSEETIYRFYQRYLKRSPHRSEVRAWARRVDDGSESMTDVQAKLLASREYFDLARRNPRLWLRAMGRDLLDREIRADEVRNWMRALDDADGNRLQVARGFLHAVNIEQRQRWSEDDRDDRDRDRDRYSPRPRW